MFILNMQFLTNMIIRQESHWRELNSRPTPYQGVAIPLSHSGDNPTNRDLGLIATEFKKQIMDTKLSKNKALRGGGIDELRN